MSSTNLRQEISKFLRFTSSTSPISYEILGRESEQHCKRILIRFDGDEQDEIRAFLLIPHGKGPFPGVLVFHQHDNQWHLGKSEVCGEYGNPLQAFGPELAKRGFAVLAPDSICFEDRRRNGSGVVPAPHRMDDWLQHYNEMAYRLVRGDFLMTKILSDAARAFSILLNHKMVDSGHVGTLGHSYGGNIVLFFSALEAKVRFACASNAACTYANKMEFGTGLEMAEVIPGFTKRFDIQDLVKCIAPRKTLLVSGKDDKYSRDAGLITKAAKDAFAACGNPENLQHRSFARGHAMTQERFDHILDWIASCAG